MPNDDSLIRSISCMANGDSTTASPLLLATRKYRPLAPKLLVRTCFFQLMVDVETKCRPGTHDDDSVGIPKTPGRSDAQNTYRLTEAAFASSICQLAASDHFSYNCILKYKTNQKMTDFIGRNVFVSHCVMLLD
jgi:hypothetical protein